MGIIRQLHDGMLAQVFADDSLSEQFEVSIGVKQGCVIAPILFVLFFAEMLRQALHENEDGVHVRCRTDGGLFYLDRLKAKT